MPPIPFMPPMRFIILMKKMKGGGLMKMMKRMGGMKGMGGTGGPGGPKLPF